MFRPENTYETEFRGKKALGVRDLGKGEPADLIIPETFAPYKRLSFGWDLDWAHYKSNWFDLAVNVLGFIPFGVLLFAQFIKGRVGSGPVHGLRKPQATSHKPQGDAAARQEIRLQASGIGLPEEKAIEQENPPLSPFFKGGKEMTPRAIILAVGLAVMVGLGVSFAIESMQAYLPSRDSSMRDLVTNTAGTAIGAVIAVQLLRNRFAATTLD